MGILGFVVVTILSIAFAAALFLRPDSLTTVWTAVRGLPLLVEIVVWLRVLVVAALIIGTPIGFFPRQR